MIRRIGREPGTSAVTSTRRSPIPPVRTMPVESTVAAARPCFLKKMFASGTPSLVESNALAESPSESPTASSRGGRGDLQTAWG